MSHGAHSTWLTLLDDTRASLIQQGCDASFAVNSEEAFRAAFELVPEVRRDSKRPRLVTSALRANRNIRTLTAGLRHASPTTLADDLNVLVWAATLRLNQAACQRHVSPHVTLRLLNDLNGVVPRFDGELTSFGSDATVQRPLQDLFHAYIDTYTTMIASLTTKDPASRFDSVAMRTRIDEEIAPRLSSFKAAYEEELSAATRREIEARKERDEQARRLKQAPPKVRQEISIDEDTGASAYNVRAQFDVQRHLGHGSFGDVTEVKEITTGEVYARKRIHLRGGSSAAVTVRDVQNEVKIMQRLHHDHIATVSFFIKEPHAYSIMMRPVADCDLLAYLEECMESNYPVSRTKSIYSWFGCILHALAYAHQLNIKHRDIKPSNILIKGSEPYLADFGVAKDFSQMEMSGSADYFVKGTPAYRAPEAQPDEPSGRAADVFALGCVYAEMLTVIKRKSLADFQEYRRTSGTASKAYAFRSNLPRVKEWIDKLATESDHLSELLVDQISTMLYENPSERPSARTCMRGLRPEMALFCDIHQ